MRVDEFELDVLLFDTGEFAVELPGIFLFADVELGLEGADGTSGRGAVGVVVVEEAEKRTEVGAGYAWEESHCSGLGFVKVGF